MKSARIITQISKKAVLSTVSNSIPLPVIKRKTSTQKQLPKISAKTQFTRIKEALQEVELIEAGKIQPTSLKDALNEL